MFDKSFADTDDVDVGKMNMENTKGYANKKQIQKGCPKGGKDVNLILCVDDGKEIVKMPLGNFFLYKAKKIFHQCEFMKIDNLMCI